MDRNKLAEFIARRFPALLGQYSQFKVADAIIAFLAQPDSEQSRETKSCVKQPMAPYRCNYPKEDCPFYEWQERLYK